MNAPRSSGVSGNGTFPDQGALRLSPTGDKTGEQSCVAKKQKARQLRFYLPDAHYDYWESRAPKERHYAFAAVIGAAKAGIDLGKLIDATGELNRVGVLLNQCMPAVHKGNAPPEFIARVEAVVKTIEGLRP